MKIHIHLRKYPSGLVFWVVDRPPYRWNRLSDEDRQNLNAAHTVCTRLNKERAERLSPDQRRPQVGRTKPHIKKVVYGDGRRFWTTEMIGKAAAMPKPDWYKTCDFVNRLNQELMACETYFLA